MSAAVPSQTNDMEILHTAISDKARRHSRIGDIEQKTGADIVGGVFWPDEWPRQKNNERTYTLSDFYSVSYYCKSIRSLSWSLEVYLPYVRVSTFLLLENGIVFIESTTFVKINSRNKPRHYFININN